MVVLEFKYLGFLGPQNLEIENFEICHKLKKMNIRKSDVIPVLLESLKFSIFKWNWFKLWL